MKKNNFIENFTSIEKTQVLSDDMMGMIESGSSCEESCKKACKPGNKGGGTDIDVDADLSAL